ncbi:MAG: amine dehydrogenase large subunit [Aquabacterium sp.]
MTRVPALLIAAALAGSMAAHAAAPAAKAAPKVVPPELPAETLQSGGSLAGGTRERVYVADVNIASIVDGRLRIFDARTGRMLGMVNTGYAGNVAFGARGDEIYVATTYLSRGGRGERTDLVEVWDSETLAFKHEIIIPPKRAQTLNYRGMVAVSGNGRFLMVQNATPATSITVVDLQQRKVAGEIPTPGCWSALPAAAHPARFSMLCGDGKLATLTLDDDGKVADRQLTDKLFDADTDAWFATAERIGDRFFFLSFNGLLTELDLSGAVARVVGAKRLVTDAQAKAGWRPGGYQAMAVHPDGRRAVVAMHDGGREGSHKNPSKALWTVDLDTGRRLASTPATGVVSVTFSRSGQRLQALDAVTSTLVVWDWRDGQPLKKVTAVKPSGVSPVQLESHD